MIERRRSPFRQSPIGAVALPGLCTEPGCSAGWQSEDLGPLLCGAHYRLFRSALAVQVAPSSLGVAPLTGVEGGAFWEAGAVAAATEAISGGQSSSLGDRRLPSPT